MGGQKQRDFAKQIVRRLRIAGYQTFWAGGCVRDMLRQVKPKDYDVATSAKPMEVKDLFRRTLMVGAKFGVVIVLGPGTQVEVATFRRDLAYKDGRRPEGIVYSDAEHDALRRDFTINGMFYDPFEDKVIDYVGGEVDIRRKVIRSIGQPQRRFAEDQLRMLRLDRAVELRQATLDQLEHPARPLIAAFTGGVRSSLKLGRDLSSQPGELATELSHAVLIA